ncbi:secreted RxLR effector protein 161-like [Coffea arabica]|uniref:Secreted RxLR effector protein 161-like n=1 Tax=Coffea arabica TaxID=13443 RepID=A0ABM4VQB9_COFAR
MARVPYSSAVGNIMYAMVCTRPDIAQVVSIVSRYMSCPDSDYAGDLDRRRSLSGYVFCIGKCAPIGAYVEKVEQFFGGTQNYAKVEIC